MTIEYAELARKTAEVARDENAADVVILELKNLTILTDYFVIASGRSTIQVRSIVERIIEVLSDTGVRPLRVEGFEEGRWVVLDYAGVIVHIFRQEERDFYKLENLWGDAPQITVGTS